MCGGFERRLGHIFTRPGRIYTLGKIYAQSQASLRQAEHNKITGSTLTMQIQFLFHVSELFRWKTTRISIRLSQSDTICTWCIAQRWNRV